MRIQLAAISIVLAFLLGCETPGSSATGAPGVGQENSGSSAPGQVVPQPFLSDEEPRLRAGSLLFMGGDGNLYVASARTERIHRITRDAAGAGGDRIYTGYAWAGDGVVYSAQRLDPGGSPRMELVSVPPFGGPVTLMEEEGNAPFFLYPTPDGGRVAFLGSVQSADGLGMGSIAIDGSDRVTHGTGQPFYAAWSPTGHSLLTHVGGPPGPDSSVLELQSVSALVRGTPGTELSFSPGVFRAPSTRSDDGGFAVLLQNELSAGIFYMSPLGEILEQIAPVRDSAAFVYSPTGGHLAFIDGEVVPSVGTMVGPLYVSTTSGRDGRVRPPELVTESAIAFFWSPDGSKLLVFKPGLVQDPEGPAVAYEILIYRVLQGDVRRIAVIRPTREFAGQVVPYFDQYAAAYTVWSPDSDIVALNVLTDTGIPAVVLMETSVPVSGPMMVSFPGYATPAVHEDGGIVVFDGIRARTVAIGTVPFFSRD